MSEVVGKYRLEVEGAIASLRKLADTSDQAAAKAERAAKSMSDSFVKGSDGAKRLDAELKKQPQTLAEMELKLQRLKELLRDDTKIGTEGFKQVTKAINDTTAAIGKANASLKETNTVGNGLVSTFKSVGAALGVAFGVTQIIAFGKEAVLLAAKAEGVERAFQRIGSPELLQGLRDATRGTVTDVVLMQNAVKANNFKIPLDQLATLFKFAQTRARATGESVDYLVDSIILGIGRKSIPILDNLGISAVELKDKLGDTAKSAATIGDVAKAVGDIATAELARVGTEADTSSDKLAQMTTAWQNFKTAVGKSAISSGVLNFMKDFIDAQTAGLKMLGGETERTLQIAANAGSVIIGFADDAKLAIEKIAKPLEDEADNINAIVAGTKLLNDAKKDVIVTTNKLAADERALMLMREQRFKPGLSPAQVERLVNEIDKTKEQIALDKVRVNSMKAVVDIYEQYLQKVDKDRGGNGSTNSQIRNIFFLKAAIAELTTKIEGEGTAIKDIMPLVNQRGKLEEELARLLGKETDAQKKLREQLELTNKLRAQVFTGAEMADGIPVVTALSSTLNGLNALLKEQQDILNSSPEFSQRYKDASDEIDKLTTKVKDFNDDTIDPALGFPNASASSIDGHPAGDEEECDFDCQIQKFQQYAQAVGNIVQGISDAIAAGHAAELASLDEQLEHGQISREQYDKKRRDLERKAAIDQKNAAIFQSIINTALAVSSALTIPPPAGYILAGISAALGAVEIGVIAAQPLPQFEKGGWVDEKTGRIDGRKHAYGGVMIEAEGGEFITNAKQSGKHADLLAAVNKGIGEKYIAQHYVKPALDRALLNGFSDIGRSAELNGLTASLKDTNIIHALDRNRHATIRGFEMMASKLKMNQNKRGGYA